MYLVSIGEIFLKGKNRMFFVKRLMSNIASACTLEKKDLGYLNQRILVYKEVDPVLLARIFGPTFFAQVIESSFDDLGENALKLVEGEKSFRISARRLQKVFKPSQKINEELGGVVLEKFPEMKVRMKGADLEIHVEILNDKALLYKKKQKGLGGLPVGVSGNVFLRIDDEKRSTLAGFLLMKRGLTLSLSKPLPLLEKFQLGCKLKIREEKEEDAVATDEVLESADLKKEEKFILRPLIAFSDKRLEELYEKIKSL